MSRADHDRQLRAALADLVDFIKIHRLSVLEGMTKRERDFLMDALHNANVALLATGDTA